MAEKPVPEYMKRYMENIGEDSFLDYDLLSKQFHNSIHIYHSIKFPSRITPARGGFTFKQDVQADLHRIGEEFKGKALDIACKKYGYKDPGYQHYDNDLTNNQENGAYSGLSRDNFDLTPEDIRAQKAHTVFEKENPVKMQYKANNRAVIDYYYSGPEGPAQRDENRSKSLSQKDLHKMAEKESRSPEANKDLLKDFVGSGEDISKSKNRFSMSDRFFMSLPSSQQTPNTNKSDPSKGRDNMEMERDI